MIKITSRLQQLEKFQDTLPVYFYFNDIQNKRRKMNLIELYETVSQQLQQYQTIAKKLKYVYIEKIIIPDEEIDNLIEQVRQNWKNEKAYKKTAGHIIVMLEFLRDGFLVIPKETEIEVFFITCEKLIFDNENNFVRYEN